MAKILFDPDYQILLRFSLSLVAVITPTLALVMIMLVTMTIRKKPRIRMKVGFFGPDLVTMLYIYSAVYFHSLGVIVKNSKQVDTGRCWTKDVTRHM